MATMTPQGTLPAAGAGMVAAPLTDTLNHIINTYNGNNADENNVDYSSADGIMVLAQAQTRTAALTQKAAFTVGEDDTGHDVKFFGATTGKSLLWDESADKLIITGDMSVSGTISDLGTVTTVDINGGTIDGATIGGASAGAGTFTTLVANTSITGTLATASQPNITELGTIGSLVATTADINAGTVDAVIGGTTPAAGTFTTLAGTTSVVAASDITITSGSILSASGAISFGNENLTTTGTLASGTITVSSDLALATGSITSASGAISFGNENLSTTGTLGAGAGTLTSLSVSDGNITNVGNIALDSISADDGSSSIQVDNALFSLNGTAVANGAGSAVFNVNGTTGGATIHLTNNIAGTTNSDGMIMNMSGLDMFFINRESGKIEFRTSDTARMEIDSVGNVGIGTSSPSTSLEVVGTTALRSLDIGLEVANGTSNSNIMFDSGASGAVSIGIDSGDMAFAVASGAGNFDYKMRIDSAGNVGIGTSSFTNALAVEKSIVGDYVAEFHNDNATAGTSYGVRIHAGTNSSDSAFDVVDQSNSTNYFSVRGDGQVTVGAGNVGIGKTPTLELDVYKATGQSRLWLDSGNGGGSYILMDRNDASTGYFILETGQGGRDDLTINANGASGITLTPTGNVLIGDTTNAYMTQGLTINQGANDDEIFALKSTDMAHGVTDTTETDTLFSIRKTSTSGGVQAQCFSEDDLALNLWGVHTNDNTTKTTGGSSTVRVTSLKKYGTTIGGPGANANLFSVFNGGVGSVFIVDAEGDLYADGGTSSTNMVTQYDEYEDAQLIRAFSTMGNAKSVIKDKWDNFVSYNEDTLVELGILGAPLKDKPLYCVTKLQKLQNGAIWQLYTQIMDMAERIEENVPSLRGKLIPQIGA